MTIETQKALVSAVTYDDVARAKELLSKGANPNIRNPKGEPMLHIAVSNNSKAMVELLIKHNVVATGRNRAGESALAPATRSGSIEIVKLLLDAGALPNDKGRRNDALLEMAFEYDSLELATLFIEKGADVNARNEDRMPFLFQAVMDLDFKRAEFLIAHNADVNIEGGHFHETPLLHFAVKQGNLKMIKLILGAKPKLDTKDDDDQTAYDIALKQDNKEIIELLESVSAVKGKRRRRDREFIPQRINGLNFASVIGLDNVKAALYRDIIYP
jgi:uncharacterized protein